MLGRRGKAERLANPASKMAEQVVADVFMRPSEGRNSMLLKLEKVYPLYATQVKWALTPYRTLSICFPRVEN